jgi:hypothetical protein
LTQAGTEKVSRNVFTGRGTSESATLVCAVSLAVALGVACGLWVNARLASPSSIIPLAPARLLPAANANGRTSPETPAATEPRTAEQNDTSAAADEVTTSHGSAEPPDAETAGTNHAVTSDKESAVKRAAVVTAPLAKEANPPAKTTGRLSGSPEVDTKRATAGQGRVAPCALYASVGSLTIRNGGAATLVVGGPGGEGRVTVTTPDWSDIALLSEGRVGVNGWMRYSVRSVSKRPGLYTVRFKTPCGSQTIPVTVTRP